VIHPVADIARRYFAPLLFIALVSTPATAATLQSPFPRPTARDAAAAAGFRCLPAPAPVQHINANRYYTDTASSIIDPALRQQNELAVKPVDDYLRNFSRMTDLYAQSGAPAVAACALDWLHVWAQGEAMLGTMSSSQAEYHRKWTLAGVALNYLKIRDDATLDPARRHAVDAWLRKLAHAVRPFFDDPRRTRNNHLYWVGLAVGASGVAIDDQALFDWGVGVYREGVRQITSEGTLPLELVRRSRAAHYHNFALAPLVMIAELGAANGLDLYAEAGGALHRLAELTVNGMVDPAYFESAARAKQGTPPRGGELAWIEPYMSRFPNARLPVKWKEEIMRVRPVTYARLGGNLTALYTRR
jgi:poly(beta-D-mannuronate) lyase